MKHSNFELNNWKKLRSGKLEWSIFHTRAKIITAIRKFFESNGFLEIEPPYLTPYPTLDSNIYSIQVSIHDQKGIQRPFFLHTSPEHAMKKLLAAGAEQIFFLGKVFRDRETTALHNPEFTMVEWYRINATYKDIQKDTEELIRFIALELFAKEEIIYQKKKIDLTAPWESVTIKNLFKQRANINLEENLTTESLKNAAASRNIKFALDDDWESLFFKIFLEKIEPTLGQTKPTFILDYPAQMGQMAKRKRKSTEWVERVELYIAGMELANGYSELTDPNEQKERFENEQKKKTISGTSKYPVDIELISALRMGIPPSAGIALGIDRLVMLFTDRKNIQDVLLFPLHQYI